MMIDRGVVLTVLSVLVVIVLAAWKVVDLVLLLF